MTPHQEHHLGLAMLAHARREGHIPRHKTINISGPANCPTERRKQTLAMVMRKPGQTAWELSRDLHWQTKTVRAALNGLVEEGFIRCEEFGVSEPVPRYFCTLAGESKLSDMMSTKP